MSHAQSLPAVHLTFQGVGCAKNMPGNGITKHAIYLLEPLEHGRPFPGARLYLTRQSLGHDSRQVLSEASSSDMYTSLKISLL